MNHLSSLPDEMSDPEKQATKSSTPSIADSDEKGRAVNVERVDSVKDAERVQPAVYNAHIDVSGVDERKLLRKLDWWLVPWLSFLYLLSFLDRTSIGNAKVSHGLRPASRVWLTGRFLCDAAVWSGVGSAH